MTIEMTSTEVMTAGEYFPSVAAILKAYSITGLEGDINFNIAKSGSVVLPIQIKITDSEASK